MSCWASWVRKFGKEGRGGGERGRNTWGQRQTLYLRGVILRMIRWHPKFSKHLPTILARLQLTLIQIKFNHTFTRKFHLIKRFDLNFSLKTRSHFCVHLVSPLSTFSRWAPEPSKSRCGLVVWWIATSQQSQKQTVFVRHPLIPLLSSPTSTFTLKFHWIDCYFI